LSVLEREHIADGLREGLTIRAIASAWIHRRGIRGWVGAILICSSP